MREVQKGEVPALKEQILKVPNPATARISSSLMELNKEFLSEFRKLRQTGS
jgi:hypothetical protein